MLRIGSGVTTGAVSYALAPNTAPHCVTVVSAFLLPATLPPNSDAVAPNKVALNEPSLFAFSYANSELPAMLP